MTEPFVIVHRTFDPIEADLLADLLRDAGLSPRVVGTRSGAAIGVGQNILEVQLAVPQSHAGEASDFLEAYFANATATATVNEGPEAAPDRPLRPLFAAGSAFLTFGVGHLYARRPITAATLAAGQLVAMYFLFFGDRWSDWTTGITMLGGVVVCDLVGSLLATRAHRRGVRRGVTGQSVAGVFLVGASMGVAFAVGPHLADPTVGPGAEEKRLRSPAREMELGRPFERDPLFPPLTGAHPANPRR